MSNELYVMQTCMAGGVMWPYCRGFTHSHSTFR